MEEAVLSINPSLDKAVTINVPGWKKNLDILYSIDLYAGVSYLCWKIKNTEHTFRILATIVFEKHGLNFSDHFELTLRVFLEDYKEWEKESFPMDWMKKYKIMYHNLIL